MSDVIFEYNFSLYFILNNYDNYISGKDGKDNTCHFRMIIYFTFYFVKVMSSEKYRIVELKRSDRFAVRNSCVVLYLGLYAHPIAASNNERASFQ